MPEDDWRRAQEECKKADLILCFGTSLRIEPAASLCMYNSQDKSTASSSGKSKGKKHCKAEGHKFGYVIVNLQKTPYDEGAALVIRGKVDDVMKGLMWRLGYRDDWDDVYDYGRSGAGNLGKDPKTAIEVHHSNHAKRDSGYLEERNVGIS